MSPRRAATPEPGRCRGSARFDDLVADRALIFGAPRAELSAVRIDQVGPVLRQVERATAAGAWAAGFVGYDAAAAFLPVPRAPSASDGLPLAWFMITDPPQVAPALSGLPAEGPGPTGPWQPAWSAAEHRDRVAAIRSAIARGDTYQANLTTTLRGHVPGDPAAFYRQLASAQHGSFHALLRVGDRVVASASPERFFRWSADELLCSPMKGTAPRGVSVAADAVARERLLDSAKERAENVMIVDLLRNDLGRIARTGTVAVSELLRAERYPSVWQLVSDIRAVPAPGVGLAEIFAALFPCGSITGAPKISTAKLLTELEGRGRGLYCGAIGYVAPPGAPVRAEFNVAIRTVVLDAQGAASYGVGGAITWDSEPAAEWAELAAKARVLGQPVAPFALLETFGVAERDGVPTAVNLSAHLARLAASADHFGFAFDRDRVERAVAAALAGVDRARVRLELARDGTAAVRLAPPPDPPARPLALAVHRAEPVDPDNPWLHHKTTNREVHERARAAHPGADEVLLVNRAGMITEATTANVVALIDGKWCTPPTTDGCLPGIERARLLDAGILVERSIPADRLGSAAGLALINSLRGWRPAELSPRGSGRPPRETG